MAEETQEQRPAQSDGQSEESQGQQSSEASPQAIQRRGGGQQAGMMRRGGGMPSVFTMDPFEMLRTSPFDLMRRLSEEMDHYIAQFGMGRGRQGMAAAGSGLFSPSV